MEGSLQWTNPVSLLPQRSDTPQSVPKSPNSPNRHSRSSFDASPLGPLPGAATARTTNHRRCCQPTRVTPQWQPLLAQARHGAPWSSPGRGPRTPLQFHTATPLLLHTGSGVLLWSEDSQVDLMEQCKSWKEVQCMPQIQGEFNLHCDVLISI